MASEYTIGLKIQVDTKTGQVKLAKLGKEGESAFKKIGNAAQRLKEKLLPFSSLVTKLGAAFAVWKLTDIAKSAVQVGASFEQMMLTVKGVMRASSNEFELLKKAAAEMGEKTEWSASQAAEALKYLGMAGFSATQAAKALPAVLDLATASGIDLARAADIASNAMTAMGLKVEDLSRVNDVLVGTITRTNTNMEMLAESFKYAAPVAHAYGYDIERLSALIGTLGNAGIQGSTAGTSLAQAFQRVSKVWKQLGKEGYGGDLIEALVAIKKAGWGAQEIMEAFGDEAGRSVLALMDNIDAIKKLDKELRKSRGETKKLADTMRSSLQGSFKALASVIESYAISAFKTYKDDAKETLESITAFLRKHKETILTIFDLMYKGMKIVLFDPLKYAVEGIAMSFRGWEMIWEGLKGSFAVFASSVTGDLADLLETIGNWGSAVENTFTVIKDTAYTAIATVVSFIAGKLADLLEAVSSWGGSVKDTFETVKDKIQQMFLNVAEAITNVLVSVLEKAENVADFFGMDSFKGKIESVISDLKSKQEEWKSSIEATENKAKSLANAHEEKKSKIQAVIEALRSKQEEWKGAISDTSSEVNSLASNTDSSVKTKMKPAIEALREAQEYWNKKLDDSSSKLNALASDKPFSEVKEHLDDMKEKTESVNNKIAESTTALHTQIRSEISTTTQTDKENLKERLEAHKTTYNKLQKAWEESLLKFGSFTDGIRVGYERMKQNAKSFAEEAYDAFNGFVQSSKSMFSSMFRDAFAGQLKSFSDYWKSFWDSMLRIFSDKLAEMVVNWMLGVKTMKEGGSEGLAGAIGGVLTSKSEASGNNTVTTAADVVQTASNVANKVDNALSSTSIATTAADAGITLSQVGSGVLAKMTLAPSVSQAGWAFKVLSKLPGVEVVPVQEGGVTLAVKGTPLAKILSTGGWASLGYGVLSQFTGLPSGIIPSITSTLGAIGGGLAGSALIGGSLGGPIGAGIGALLGGVFGGLFGGGKKHPGKYAWEFSFPGIKIDPDTGKVQVGTLKFRQTMRADESVNRGWEPFGGIAQTVLYRIGEIIQGMPDEMKVMLIEPLEKVNENLKSFTFSTHLETLRQQQPALFAFETKYLIPGFLKGYVEPIAKMWNADFVKYVTEQMHDIISLEYIKRVRKTGVQETIDYYKQAGFNVWNKEQLEQYLRRTLPEYGEGGISWKPEIALVGEKGPEAHIPLKHLSDLKEELKSLKEFLWMLLNATADQTKYSKKQYQTLLKWDANGLPVASKL